MNEHIIKGSEDNFQKEVIESDLPVLVDFWADWCGPCKMIAPILDNFSEKYKDRLKIVKVNVDENKELPAKYGVRGIPTLIIFNNGSVKDQSVGALSPAQLAAFIDKSL